MTEVVILKGKRSICNFLGRSWMTVEKWINTRDFPARKIDGIWESDSELIRGWRRRQINGGQGDEAANVIASE